MNLLVVSDLHLGPAHQQRADEFLCFLKRATQMKDEVLIVGDLFALWFGRPKLTFEYQQAILQQMKVLVAEGLVMNYVEGNRDFGIGRYEGSLFRKVSDSWLERDWNGTRIYAEHGDLINSADLQYRIWRAFSKNPLSFFLLDHLPSSLILRMSSDLEREMQTTNQKHKSYFPDESCRKFYLRHFERGVDIVIVGHFHCEKEIRVQAANRDVLFYSLPGWEQGFRYLVIPEDKRKPYFEELR